MIIANICSHRNPLVGDPLFQLRMDRNMAQNRQGNATQPKLWTVGADLSEGKPVPGRGKQPWKHCREPVSMNTGWRP